ncbi:MAG TPA: DUF6152 family protein [Terriglobia bacterium]|nr:DUF6152 family protein [Terriglobia bacterium]
MKTLFLRVFKIAMLALPVVVSLFVATTPAHHSFAMYDMTKTVTFTGVVTRFVSQANHAEIHFVPLGPDAKPQRGSDGKYTSWGVEMGGAAAMAQQGISVTTFPVGTIFSVNLHPLRDGKNFGSMEGPISKCPKDTPPPPSKHCNEVQGSTSHGRGNF